jgi:hypothetical protein
VQLTRLWQSKENVQRELSRHIRHVILTCTLINCLNNVPSMILVAPHDRMWHFRAASFGLRFCLASFRAAVTPPLELIGRYSVLFDCVYWRYLRGVAVSVS